MKTLAKMLIFSCIVVGVNAQEVVLEPVCFNTEYDDYGMRMIGDELFVVSASKNLSGVVVMDKKKNRPFSDIYKIQDCKFAVAEIYSADFKGLVSMSSSTFDGPISSNSSGDLLFFNNSNGKELGKSIGIYWSQKNEEGWSNPLSFFLNSKNYSVAHPFYDDATDRLYFTSDIESPGKHWDIFYSEYIDGKFGDLISVKEINTDANEMFPVIHEGKLYYSSNGEASMGGLDMFVLENGKVRNLGEPFNSEYDDLSILFTSNNEGYITSNRNSLGSNDDIFSFTIMDAYIAKSSSDMKRDLISEQITRFQSMQDYSSGLGMNPGLNGLLSENVELIEGRSVKDISEGELAVNYINMTNINSFYSEQIHLIQEGAINNPEYYRELSKRVMSISAKSILAKTVQFNFNSYDLTEVYKGKLAPWIGLITEDSDIRIHLKGHADSIGSEKINIEISMNRAIAVQEYLVNQGVPEENIFVTFHGDFDPVAPNESQEGRDLNRRVEIIVLEF